MEDTPSEKNIDISIVVPVYNEEESLPELEKAISKALSADYSYEIIFVDDGSSDKSWQQVLSMGGEKDFIHGIALSHNYGKSVALQAGFEKAQGKYVVTMDADLQDDPNEVPEMVQMLKDGYDLVSGWKKERHDPISKTIPSKFFNFVTRKVAGIELHDFNCGLKAYRAEVVKNIYLYGELHRYIPMLAKREGYTRITEKVVTHHPRKYGKTKFGLSRFMNGFLDLITITFVQRYLQKPMHFFGTVGVLLLLAGGGINLYMALLKFVYRQGIGDRPLLFLGILLMVVGVQFFSTGLLGEMINKNNVKDQKPRVREII
ncbi:MAG: glycosyltransferase family 2 protein [Gracilimonas sp.]|uniref:glycosyltransferase family 2 protein n=1 Tax=Gracilimonas TaxID=649462 RepID=UPI001B1F1421|nr:glycosyltransferase family 2 protein [Gracilimonas sp.]MBO6585874.1 glycosyltransferase family 2 protein [Gracilimonas sp.]MBO6616871.1 glycosyltransferase family 2 protein [Gracilimonas sp.]